MAEAETHGLKPPMVSAVLAETPVAMRAAVVDPILAGFIRNSPRPVFVRPKAPVRACVVVATRARSAPLSVKTLPCVTLIVLAAARTYWWSVWKVPLTESVPPLRLTKDRRPLKAPEVNAPPRLASFETTRLPALTRQEVPTMAGCPTEATTPAVVEPAISRIP